MSRRWFAGFGLIGPAILALAPLALLVGWGTPAAALVASPEMINFGQVPLNTTVSQTVTATIDAGYTAGGVLAEGEYGLSADTCDGFVGPGTCTMTFTFTPTELGTPTQDTSFSETVTGGNAYQETNIYLEGTGVQTLTAPPTVDFGLVPLGTTVSKTLTLTADTGFTIAGPGVSSGTQPPFGVIDDTCAGFTGPGTCTFTETFTPTAVGAASGTISRIERDSNDTNDSTLGFMSNVTGSGVLTPLPVVVTGSQTYGMSDPAFAIGTAAPSGDSFAGTLQCTTVGSPSETISPSLTAGRYTINGSSCSGLTLSGPTGADYAVSYGGSTFTVNKAPTTLVAAPVSLLGSALSLRVTYSATLVVSGTIEAVPGQAVNFSDGPLTTCTGTTNANGVATCTVSGLGFLAVLFSRSYNASFGGSADYVSSSARGAVTLV